MIKISQLPSKPQQLAIVLAVTTLALFAYLFDESLSSLLNYHRASIGEPEYWRLLSAHFFHTNGYHLMLNLAALWLLWALHGHFYTIKNYLVVFMVCSLTSALGVHYFSLDITSYVGLSGTLHGIFMWGAMLDIAHKEKTGYLLLLGGWLKIAHEQLFGASSDVSNLIDAHVAVDAHLFGAIGGMVIGTVTLYKLKAKNKAI